MEYAFAMARVLFTANLQRHLPVPELEQAGNTVRVVLEGAFAANPRLRGYVVDDQGELRKHVTIFVDGARIRDRITLSDSLSPTSEVHVFQALSGG